MDPLPLAVEEQLLPELQQLLAAIHQEGRLIPADGLCAAGHTVKKKKTTVVYPHLVLR